MSSALPSASTALPPSPGIGIEYHDGVSWRVGSSYAMAPLPPPPAPARTKRRSSTRSERKRTRITDVEVTAHMDYVRSAVEAAEKALNKMHSLRVSLDASDHSQLYLCSPADVAKGVHTRHRYLEEARDVKHKRAWR